MASVKSWLAQDPVTGAWRMFKGNQTHSTVAHWTAVAGATEVQSFEPKAPTTRQTPANIPAAQVLQPLGGDRPLSEVSELVTATISRDPSAGYGIKFGGAANQDEGETLGYGIFVKQVRPNTPAAAAGTIQVGMQIISMNGTDLSSGTFVDLNAAVQELDGVMTLQMIPNPQLYGSYNRLQRRASFSKVFPQSGDSSTDDAGPFTVTIPKDENGFGIRFGGARDREDAAANGGGVFIAGVIPGSSAHRIGAVKIGMQITVLNGIYLKGKTFVELKDALADIGDTLELELIENTALYRKYQQLVAVDAASQPATASSGYLTTQPNPVQQGYLDTRPNTATRPKAQNVGTVTTSLTKDASGYGLKFGGAKNDADASENGAGVFVSGTKPGSVADNNPEIKAGLQIVSLNGFDMTAGTFATLKVALYDVGATLQLELRENPALAAAYDAARSGAAAAVQTQPAGDAGTVTTSLTKDANGFGLKFGGAKNDADAAEYGAGVFISGTKPGSVAARNPAIKEGLQIVSLNGTDMVRGSFTSLKEALSGAGDTLQLVLKENPMLASSYNVTTATRSPQHPNPTTKLTVKTPKDDKFQVDIDDAATVGQAKETIAAAKDLEAEGMKLTYAGKILGDGVVVSTLNIKESEFVVVVAKPAAKTAAARRAPPIASGGGGDGGDGGGPATLRTVLTKDGGGFGLKFGGALDDADGQDHGFGVFISGLVPGSVASTDPVIRQNLQVLSMNGVDLTRGTFDRIRDALKQADGNSMSLEMTENQELAAQYNNLKADATAAATGGRGRRGSLHASGARPNAAAASPAVISTSLTRNASGYGLKFGGARDATDASINGPGLFISGTKPGSVASLNEDIADGLQIVTMNGTDLTNGTFDDLKAVLGEAAETITLELLANPDLATKYTAIKSKEARPSMHGSKGAKAASITLTRDANGYGLKFGGARNQKDAAENGPGVFVSGTKPNSVASRHDGVRDGFQIVTMNGIDLTGGTFEELKGALASTGDTLSLELIENAELASKYSAVKGREARKSLHSNAGKAAPSAPISTSLTKGPGGFGIVFEGARNPAHGEQTMLGIFVGNTKPGSAAAANPQISAGMQLTKINGIDLSTGTFEDLKQVLGQLGGNPTLQLELENNPALVAAHAK